MSSFELMCVRPMNLGLRPYSVSNLMESTHNYVQYLKFCSRLLFSQKPFPRDLKSQGSERTCQEEVGHPCQLGDFIYIKVFQKKDSCHQVGGDPICCCTPIGYQSEGTTQLGSCFPCEASTTGGLDCGSLKGPNT